MKKTCSIDGCDRFREGRGLCAMHYQRLRKTGRTTLSTEEERFWSNVQKTKECWRWTGNIIKGYGTFSVRELRRSIGAHRWAYEHLVGPIPDGKVVDHLCHTAALYEGECAGGETCPHRSCVNPGHMVLTTLGANLATGNGIAARNRRKTHCQHGHEFTPENTYIIRKTGARVCRTCSLAEQKKRRATQRG